MNNWEVLIIPLIAFGAWILSTIFKADDKTKDRLRRVDGRGGVRTPRRPAPQEATREEPRRRRDMPEGMESRQQRTRPGQPPIIAPRRPAPAQRSPGSSRPAPVLAMVIEEPQQVVVRRPAAVAKAPETLPVPLPAPSATPVAPLMPMSRREQSTSPVLQEVVRLLRTPRTAAAALVMREILDRPIGLRRR